MADRSSGECGTSKATSMWDKQGVLRGQCECGECQEFMVGPGVRCEYCECTPVKHTRIDTIPKEMLTTDFSQVTYNQFPTYGPTKPSGDLKHAIQNIPTSRGVINICPSTSGTSTFSGKQEKKTKRAKPKGQRKKKSKAHGTNKTTKAPKGNTVRCSEAGCDEEFATNMKMRIHIKAKHKSITCSLCDATFFLNRLYKLHLASCCRDNMGNCKEELTSSDEGTLLDGACGLEPVPSHGSIKPRAKQSGASGSEYPCQFCGKMFRHPCSVIVHERTHTGDRPFKCSLCELSFKSRGSLRLHQLVHSCQGKHQCQFCGRRFHSSNSLVHHEYTHTGEKPYECKECGKRFGHRSVLNTHARVHSGERPFSCPHCAHGFLDRSTLRKHIRTHTLEKPYRCKFCARSFNQKWYVRVHERSHATDRGVISPTDLVSHPV